MEGSFRMGDWVVEPQLNCLSLNGKSVRTEPKVMQVLVFLVEHAGEVVTKERLISAIWADTFVTDDVLTRSISELRRIFEDDPREPRVIQTIPKRGYRLIAPVWPAQPARAAAGVELPTLGRPAIRRRYGALVGLSLLALLVAGGYVVFERFGAPKRPPADKIMLVVLPFQNLSGDPGQEYFSDGMTEELSEQLGELSPLRLGVIGRTSAMTYKHSQKTIGQIGKELSVEYALEGSVRRDGNKVRVTAQLVRVSDQSHVWAQSYDRDLVDLLQMEGAVAGEIARRVGVSTVSVIAHIPNPEAHEAYLLGRYYWNKRTPADIETGQRYFRRAIQKDPEYAAAYAGLAFPVSTDEATAAATKAVELDPNSGEAHSALAEVKLYHYLDWTAAEREFKLAIQLDPNYPTAHHWYGNFLEMRGQRQQSVAELRQAVLLDPLSPILKTALAEVLRTAGQNGAAEEQLKQVLEIDANFPVAHLILGRLYRTKQMYKEAVAEFQAAAEHGYGTTERLGDLGYTYALSGNRAEALATLSELKELAKRSGSDPDPVPVAIIEIGLGNKDEALSWLERAEKAERADQDYDDLLSLKADPTFDPLRSDPRFQDLERRVGLPP